MRSDKLVYLGIDQTGAVDSKGRPKKLPVCILVGNEIQFSQMAHFSKAEIQNLIGTKDLSGLRIVIDCVLGLPKELGISWRQALPETLNYPGFGRKPAQEYFRHLAQGKFYQRKIEVLLKANSVFQEHPFQKNIQTGTFRFWKEMAQDPDWFFAAGLSGEIKKNRVPVFEGYPSYSWKKLFKTFHREPQSLGKILAFAYPDLQWNQKLQKHVDTDKNFGDSFVLALAGKLECHQDIKKRASVEGSILGS